jgi:hypothetical protein
MTSKKLNLSNVTLICVNGSDPAAGIRALRYSMKDILFFRAILFSHIKPSNITQDIEFIEIEKLDHDTSSIFSMKGIHPYITTDFCLSIHDDGFVTNPHLWDPNFLKYDYIGAPWEEGHIHRVGNGGFCLKSKRFIELCQQIPWHPGQHDDVLTCQVYREFFIQNGCKYAPVEVAMKFSLETKITECEYNLNNCFGFHGRGDVGYVFQGEGQQFKDKIKLLDVFE